MKLRKGLVCLIISIIILAMSTNTFAATSKKKVENTVVENKVSNTVSNETKKDKTDENKAENTVKNTTKNETTKSSSKTTITKTSKTETINEDVVNAESDDNLEYKDVTVNGNMFLANSDKITLTNVIVDGDVIAFADEIEIVDSEINGNVVAAGDKITVLNSEITSIYAAGENVRFDEGTVINRELRAAGQTVTINAKVNRDVYVGGETVKFGDDSIVKGKAVVRSENKSVSDDADIENLDYKKSETNGIVVNLSTENKVISYIIGKGTEIAIILIIALFILYGFPKFSEVNSCLRLRDFFKAFFTGLLEFIVIISITIGLFFTGYGAGYGLILLNLLFTFLILGKVIFIVSFAVRMSCGPEKVSKVKAFFATVLVALILAVIEMISIAGAAGFIIDLIINCVLAFTGLGSMFRVIFTSKKKLENLAVKKSEGKTNVVETTPVVEVASETVNEPNPSEEAGQAEIKHEVKAEIKEEVEELKEEREEEKKLEESASEIKDDKEPEVKEEQPEKVEESKEEKKEDSNKDEEDKKKDDK